MHGWENLKPEDENLILEGIREGTVLGGPYHVEIDPMDLCNVDCFFCGSAHLHEGGVFHWKRLEPIVDELIAGGLRAFRLAGGGEPMIYPDLELLIQKMATAGVTLDMVTTNGVNLHQKADLLLRCKLSEMMISLNYSSEDHYAKFMRTAGAKFHKVVENIRLMDQKLREQNRRKETWLATQFFLHRSTVEGLIAMAELGATLPVDILTIKAIGGIPDEEVILPSQYDRILELLPAVVDKLRGRLTFHIDLDVLGLQQQANALMADHRRTSVEEVAPLHAIEYCYIGWYSMTIQGNGDVHACCYLMNDDRIAPLGNLNHQSVQEVWRGPGYQKFRQEMRTAMLFSEKTPFQQRRFKCTQPACWEHDQCPLSYLMATPDFYRRAHEHLETLRKKPGQALIIAANSLSRKVIESVKKATPLR